VPFKNDAIFGTIFQLVFAGSFGTTWKLLPRIGRCLSKTRKLLSKKWKASYKECWVVHTYVFDKFRSL